MNDSDFERLCQSIKQAGEIRRGTRKASRVFHHSTPDVKAIRTRLGLTQTRFAALMGVSGRTLQHWEQGRRQPEGPAKALLRVVEREPQAVLQALHA
jgi:putative transcriptional regulator